MSVEGGVVVVRGDEVLVGDVRQPVPARRVRAPSCGTPSSGRRCSAYRPSCPPPSIPIVAGGVTTRPVTSATHGGGSTASRRLLAAFRPVRVEPGRRAPRRRPRGATPRTARRSWRPPHRSRTSPRGHRPASARSSTASPDRTGDETATGTPSTGTVVLAASMPGRWAAPPAPAMIARNPRSRADSPRRRTSRQASDGR